MKKLIININPKVHYSIHNRKVFKGKMWLITLIYVLVLLGCGAMFTFGTVTWNPDEGFSPKANPQYWWQTLLVVCGAILAVAAIVTYVLVCYWIFKSFYATQEAYFKTSEFKKAKANALKTKVYKLKKKNIKWYKKMGYITSDQQRQALEEQKLWIQTCKNNKEKVNYAELKA